MFGYSRNYLIDMENAVILDVEAMPAAALLPAPWPGGSPRRSLWVIINAHWYYAVG